MRLLAEPEPYGALRKRARECLPDDRWQSIGRLGAKKLERQLARELPEHELLAREPRAIARARDSDDVLYALKDRGIACVHLGWSGGAPTPQLFAGFDDFMDWLNEETAFVEAIESTIGLPEQAWICSNCGADWSQDKHGVDCTTCGGYGMIRPCPICGGRCGSWWRRALLDSNERSEAHWIGRCSGDSPGP